MATLPKLSYAFSFGVGRFGLWCRVYNLLYLDVKIEKGNIKKIQELCRINKVKSLFAFGSVVRDDFHDTSDIDLVVDIDEADPFKYADIYFNFKSQLEDLLKKEVDLIEERAIRNRIFRQQLDRTKVKIYEC